MPIIWYTVYQTKTTQQPTCLPMGWDGEIVHGTSLQDISVSTTRINKTMNYIYIYTYYHIYYTSMLRCISCLPGKKHSF